MVEKQINALKPHISINVSNIRPSVEFYTHLFGIEPVKYITGDTEAESETPRRGYAKFDVSNPPLNFVLNESKHRSGGTLSHLGIQVAATEDVIETQNRWRAAGLSTVEEMKTDCCYALQDKAWARDPDGNEWEVFVVLQDTQPAGEACDCGDRFKPSELSAGVCCGAEANENKIVRSEAACC